MSGVLSHSLDVADASPNTKTFASVDTNENSLGSTDSISGRVPTNFTALSNATLNYLNLFNLQFLKINFSLQINLQNIW